MGLTGLMVNYCNDAACSSVTTVTGLASTTMCVQGGDSGGPVYAQHRGYGIVSGYMVNASPCHSWYYGLGGAQVNTNTTILTGTS
jgi:hypothetical protein